MDIRAVTYEEANVPLQRYGHTAVVHGSHMYVWGGCDLKGSYDTVLYSFSFSEKKWAVVPCKGAIPTGRHGHTATMVRNRMFVFGGSTAAGTVSSLDVFDFEKHEWTSARLVGEIPSPRHSHTANLHGKLLYILCGSKGLSGLGSKLYSIDTETFVCKALGDCTKSLGDHAAAVIGNSLWVYGGWSTKFKLGIYASSSLLRYSFDSGEWTEIAPKGGEEPAGRHGHTMLEHNTSTLLVFGGAYARANSELWTFDIALSRWSRHTLRGSFNDLPKERHNHTAVLYDGSMYIFGGDFGAASKYFNDMFAISLTGRPAPTQTSRPTSVSTTAVATAPAPAQPPASAPARTTPAANPGETTPYSEQWILENLVEVMIMEADRQGNKYCTIALTELLRLFSEHTKVVWSKTLRSNHGNLKEFLSHYEAYFSLRTVDHNPFVESAIPVRDIAAQLGKSKPGAPAAAPAPVPTPVGASSGAAGSAGSSASPAPVEEEESEDKKGRFSSIRSRASKMKKSVTDVFAPLTPGSSTITISASASSTNLASAASGNFSGPTAPSPSISSRSATSPVMGTSSSPMASPIASDISSKHSSRQSMRVELAEVMQTAPPSEEDIEKLVIEFLDIILLLQTMPRTHEEDEDGAAADSSSSPSSSGVSLTIVQDHFHQRREEKWATSYNTSYGSIGMFLSRFPDLFTLVTVEKDNALARTTVSVDRAKAEKYKAERTKIHAERVERQRVEEEEKKKKEKEQRRNNMRQNLSRELLATEQSYVGYMTVLMEIFVRPLRDGQLLSAEDTRTVFPPSLESLQQFHKDLLLPRLKARMENWTQETCVADVFLSNEIVQLFNMYKSYADQYEKATSVLETKMTQGGKFEQTVRTLLKNPSCTRDGLSGQTSLASYLIMPVQRVMRYPMLFAELLKNTDSSHPDYNNLAQALEKMKKISENVNNAVKSGRMHYFCDHIENFGEQVMNRPDRHFLAEHNIKVLERAVVQVGPFELESTPLSAGQTARTSDTKRVRSNSVHAPSSTAVLSVDATLILFTDIVLIVVGGKIVFKLELCKVWMDVSTQHINESIILRDPEFTLLCLFPTTEKRDDCMHALNDQVLASLAAAKITQDDSGARSFSHTYSDGGVYEGTYRFGHRSGSGETINDKLDGRMKYADGSVYEGPWESDMREGEGTLTFSATSVYLFYMGVLS
eukprot:TRINITY_DN1433_c0_g1_i5.p1 TRINITY_DN1433_c0_g1~~TRINITY_DN1433_c0_g1_i5.p1  ORF type:complete len:1189 (-),score=274.84 TRINITY_DN1433_c0_g1_i5:717-4283(-)